jgi:hypothetical protein
MEQLKRCAYEISQKFKVVRLKDRINTLGDLIINFRYGVKHEIIAEMQLVYQPNQSHINKAYHKVMHFKYELTRNPMGLIAHCVELILKS